MLEHVFVVKHHPTSRAFNLPTACNSRDRIWTLCSRRTWSLTAPEAFAGRTSSSLKYLTRRDCHVGLSAGRTWRARAAANWPHNKLVTSSSSSGGLFDYEHASTLDRSTKDNFWLRTAQHDRLVVVIIDTYIIHRFQIKMPNIKHDYSLDYI